MNKIPFKKWMMPKKVISQGVSYSLLFALKESPSKQVYKALRKDKHTGLEQEVLLKIFSPEDTTYKGELESLIQVDSPYCVKFLGFESFSKKRALVLEYIQGVSLSQLLETFPLSKEDINYLLSSIYQGLVHLETQGLCHGDLSLNNIFINQQAQIKFIDFGKGNYQGGAQGTFPFVAPEILTGRQPNFYSDLFSLGVIEEFLKNPLKQNQLSKKKPEDFIATKNSLLVSDPLERSFSPQPSKQAQASLTHKVQILLSRINANKTTTQELFPNPPMTPSQKKRSAKQVALLFCLGLVLGPSSFSDFLPSQGFLKVITHKWFFVQLKAIRSYTPLQTSLSPGWYFLNWKSASKKGRKLIYIRTGETLLLNDKDFYTDE